MWGGWRNQLSTTSIMQEYVKLVSPLTAVVERYQSLYLSNFKTSGLQLPIHVLQLLRLRNIVPNPKIKYSTLKSIITPPEHLEKFNQLHPSVKC